MIDSDYILKDISFIVLPKEKIGIVGRTGAGKSSLINALFRLACIEGEIRIVDISTTAIALHNYRSKISINPQEPFLFTGSLQNLDPFDQYSDSILWQALQNVELKEIISQMAGGLNTKISDEGLNFSIGQRQLFCFARAIIKNNRIMILDEATANIDPYTDSLIQKTIKTKFINCTVFTVAHRLNTIMDSDRIFIMNAGSLVRNRGQIRDRLRKGAAVMSQVWGIGKRKFKNDWGKRLWLFDKLVMGYGVEIWEWRERKELEKLHESYLRWVSGVE
ncbi:probable multidrug resistance-associated protein lethal(2)03659 [Cataglyphis hispanica]|uniref:probable multidrug resistance-associated protein lethal(2)03659 n=1 Tax=Cataglyphis hispanica TaxID=1086592 RepID=UPI00217FDE37|nr:probable multidrug resistance-associated protein lethal(2)03659 [Cataglyphis hispanica]